jgi:putative two-component system response regulator
MGCPNYQAKPFKNIDDSRILIVDDQETNVRLLEYLLHRSGHRSVRGATDPRTVVEIYKEYSPDLVLLDLVMPHINGVKLMQDLQMVKRETYPTIIIISASENDEAEIRSLALGAIDFLAKPFNRVEVVRRIEAMLKIQPVSQSIKKQEVTLKSIGQERTQEWADGIVNRITRPTEYKG